MADNYISVQASQGASVLVRDTWYEGGGTPTFAQVSDNSVVTIEGSRVAVPTGRDAIQINNLSCQVTELSSMPDGDVNISGSGNGNVWVVGNNYGAPVNFFSNMASGVLGAFNLNRYNSSSQAALPVTDITAIPNAGFIRTMLAQSRAAHPRQIQDLAAGLTDARFYRIVIEAGTVGIHLEK
jgi:hypothetical protein